MTTPPTPGTDPTGEGARWADPSLPPAPPAEPDPAAEAPFDPYRFGAPEHPVPPEYAPPGYVPPPPPPAAAPPSQPQQYPYQPYGQQQYPYAPPPYGTYPQPRTSNGKAIAALVLGILSLLFFWLTFIDLALIIPAIVFGALGLGEAKRPGGTGRGLAMTGLILAVVGALAALVFTVAVLPKAVRCANDYPRGTAEYDNCLRDIFR